MRKQFQKSAAFLIFLFIGTLSHGQIVVSEVISPFLVELQNKGSDTVNVDQYWLCNRPAYDRIGSLNAECGSINMPPGGFVVVATNQIQLNREGGELGIYQSGDFGNSNEIIDYVIWGDRSDQTRESVAVAAGIWTQDDRAPAYTQENSLLYDGEGDTGTDYYLGQSNQCTENVRCDVIGGQLATIDGLTSLEICAGDGISDAFDVSLDTAQGENMAWIITDTLGIILDLPSSPPFDLDSSGAGVCLIWNISFQDTISGLMIGASANDISGCFELSNAIRVTRFTGDDCPEPPCDVEGGTLQYSDGSEEASICIDDNAVDMLQLNVTGSVGVNNAYVITDTSLNILVIDTSGMIDVDELDPGICLIWYLSYDSIEGAVVDSNAANLSGCFDLSNSVRLNKLAGEDCPTVECDVTGGQIATREGNTEVDICIDDADEDLVIANLSGATGANQAWVITDSDLTIIAVDTNTSVFSLESRGEGVCFIWNLSYEGGLTGLGLSTHKDSLSGCFEYSNSIRVNRLAGDDCPMPPCEVDGGTLTFTDGSEEKSICVDDDGIDLLELTVSGATGTNKAYVITDTNLNILRIDTSGMFDIDDLGGGTCLIWHLSYDMIDGAEVDSNAANLSGCFALSNSVIVNKLTGEDCPMAPCEVEGGILAFMDGSAEKTICIDDDAVDLLELTVSGATGTNKAYVITDTNLNILRIDTSGMFDVDDLGAGTCLIWHLSYDMIDGAEVDSNAANLSGCFSLSNSVIVNKLTGEDCPMAPCEVEGGILAFMDGSAEKTICIDDAMELFELTVSGATGSNQAYVITDTSLRILRIDTFNIFSVDDLGAGTCLIWHLSFDMIEGAVIDSNAANLSGCFSLSNSVTVNKLTGEECPMTVCEVSGGMIATRDGFTEVDICVDDADEDLIIANLSGDSGSNQAWVVTDSNMVIIALETNTSVFSLESRGAGVCFIWSLSYEAGISGLTVSVHKDSLSGCFEYSNSIRVNRVAGEDCPAPPCEVEGGTISVGEEENQINICIDDNITEIVEVDLSGASGPNMVWVLTDTNLNILNIDTSNIFDLETAGEGVCLIWHLSYETIEGAEIDSNAANLSGCFDLSNALRINRLVGSECVDPCRVDGGMIATIDSLDEVTICIDDAVMESVSIMISGATGSNSAIVVTDDNLNILSVDSSTTVEVEQFGEGVCLIWHVSYQSLEGATVGANAGDLSGCFDLSNSITVNKVTDFDCPNAVCEVEGGILTTEEGATEIVICGGTSSSGPFNVMLDSAVGTRSAWIITDSARVILGFPLAPPFNLSGAAPGTYSVWHLTYEGSINGATLGSSIDDLSGCFALSNPIVVQRADIRAGEISFADGMEQKRVCSGDGLADEIEFMITGNQGQTTWLITNPDGVISKIIEGASYDFEGSEDGQMLVWAVSHAQDISGLEEGENANDLSGCFELSNSLSVTSVGVDGGVLSTEIGGSVIEICVGDSIMDNIDLVLSEAQGDNMSFLVSDSSGSIIKIVDELSSEDFDDLPAGTCLIWHISYGNDLTGLAVGSDLSDLSGCFDLSNFVTLKRLSGDDCPPPCTVEPGILTTPTGETDIEICVNDGVSDVFELTVVDAVGPNQAFMVVDELGNILGIESTFQADLETTNDGVLFVRHISYDENAEIPEAGGNINMLVGCYALSNIFTINRVSGDRCAGICSVDGGILSSDLGDEITFCVDDDEADLIEVSVTGNEGDSNIYVITDAVANILSLTDLGTFDFSNTESDACLIWNLSYTGSLTGLMIGGNANDLDGCFDLSNSISVTKLIGDECPDFCSTDGGMIMTIEGETEMEFCKGEVLFSVIHQTENEDSTAEYFYIITKNDGEIISWRNSMDGMDFDLSNEPEGECRVYGYNSSDISALEIGSNIDALEFDCARLSSNYITITKTKGGSCDEGCHRPRNIRIQEQGSNRYVIRWDRVNEATDYIVRLGIEGLPNSFSEIRVSRNRIILSGPPNRTYVIQIASVCSIVAISDFTREFKFGGSNSGSAALGRSSVIHHGTVLPSGIIITEQAVAYPNPASEIVNVWYDGQGIDGNMIMFDRIGRKVMSRTLSGQQEIHQIRLDNFENGFYFIVIESEGQILLQDKLVKTDHQ